jgi:hypothetical protein
VCERNLFMTSVLHCVAFILQRLSVYPCNATLLSASYCQVGFHDSKAVKKITVAKRINEIVNRLNHTKREEANPDLAGEREAYDKEVIRQT